MESILADLERIEAELEAISSRIDELEAIEPRIEGVIEKHEHQKTRVAELVIRFCDLLGLPIRPPAYSVQYFFNLQENRIIRIRGKLNELKREGGQLSDILREVRELLVENINETEIVPRSD